MATNIQEALAGGLSVTAKPVAMEQLPDATIDVSGGSLSLGIEGLGVKRKKDDLSAVTSSTSQIAMQDLFGDLLDEVNFSDPNSVDVFRNSAQTRIDEMDSGSLSNALGQASSVAQDVSSLVGFVSGEDKKQDQFTQVFGPPAPTSIVQESADDFGVGSDLGTGVVSTSSLENPDLAAQLTGQAFGAIASGDLSKFGTSLASGAIGASGAGGPLSGAGAAFSLANADITNAFGATQALSSALTVAQQAASVQDLVTSGKSFASIFEQGVENIKEYAQGVWSAVTNPAAAIEAFGMSVQYGTQTPDLYSFDMPGGQINFNFDAKTGSLATPGLIGMMLGNVPGVGAMSRIAQTGMKASGYLGDISDRAQGMANAFSTPGHQISISQNGQAGVTGFSNPSSGELGGYAAIDMTDVPGSNIGAFGIDMGSLADSLGPNGTVDSLTREDIEQHTYGGFAGPPTGTDPEDLATYEEEAQAAKSAIAEAYGNTAAEISATTQEVFSNYTQSFMQEFEALGGKYAVGMGAMTRADALTMSHAAAYREDPARALTALNLQYERDFPEPGRTNQTREEVLAEQRIAFQQEKRQTFVDALPDLGQGAADDYNSQNPSPEVVTAVEQLGLDGLNANVNEDSFQKEQVAVQMAINRGDFSTGREDAPGLGGGTGGVSMTGYEAAGAAAAEAVAAAEIDFGEGEQDESSIGGTPGYDPGVDEPGSPDSESDGEGSDTCVIATHAVAAKSFSARDKAKAEVWCARKYHGKWYGELFRRGYKHAGKKAINRGEAAKHYQEFKDFVSYGRGLKKGWRQAVNYHRRTAQFFLTGLMLATCEKFKAE